MGPEPVAVDIRGAMKMLNLGRSSVLPLADSGELTRLRFGRRVVFEVSDIEALVENQLHSGPAEVWTLVNFSCSASFGVPPTAAVTLRHRDGRQQSLGVGMFWRGEDLPLRRHLDDLAEIHHGNTVRHVLDDREIMVDEQQREAELELQIL